MSGMQTFTITELSFSVMTILGGLSGLFIVLWKSRCIKIRCLWGCIYCEREVPQIEEEETRSVDSVRRRDLVMELDV